MFRVLEPGGIAVITDSFQKGDIPERDHIGKRFPANYHEPYYMSYFENTDLVPLLLLAPPASSLLAAFSAGLQVKIYQEAGFVLRTHQCAHLSKVTVRARGGES